MICEQCARDADPPKCWWCDSPIQETIGCPAEFLEAACHTVFEWFVPDLTLTAIYSGRVMWLPFDKLLGSDVRRYQFPKTKAPLFSWLAEHEVVVGVAYEIAYQEYHFTMETEKEEDHWFASQMISDACVCNDKLKFTFIGGVVP